MHHQHANYSEALVAAKEILDISMEIFGKHHPSSASAHNNVGLMHKMMGEFDESRERHYHTALRLYGDIVGKDHSSYAAALNNLGNLDRAQSMTDENLTAVQRLGLNDTAVEYFEEAWNIRVAELGDDHSHTVTSRSNLGGSIAAQVIQSESIRQAQLRKDKEQNEDNEKNDKASSWKMTKFTKQKWDLAEDHLRSAFRTAINNPRGKKIDIPAPSGTNNDPRLPPRRTKGMSKKEKHKASKVRKQIQKELASLPEKSNEHVDSVSSLGDTSIRTVSAAAAAQNLAVFLKSRADLVRSSMTNDFTSTLDEGDMYAEAKNLYVGALRVRNELRGSAHPDTVATKFSFAELIDTLGDEKEANKLRSEILDEYGVQEVDDETDTKN
jgi:tetratricopeptide (TPR) repeat protein